MIFFTLCGILLHEVIYLSAKLRLDKMLSHMGIGSRRNVRGLIKIGKVSVNGIRAMAFDMQIDPDKDEVICMGSRVLYKENICLMMNKPAGYISATEDKKDKTVMELLKPPYSNMELFIAGRLDKDTEGFLILTNDGKLAHNMLAPKKHVDKVYKATVKGELKKEDAQAFEKGINIGNYITQPAKLEILQSGELSQAMVTIHEGRFHQIKRMFEQIGKEVVYLKRIKIGELLLDDKLELGEVRMLSDNEVKRLLIK